MLFTKTQSSVEQAVWPPKLVGRPSIDATPAAFHIRLLGRLLVGRGFINSYPCSETEQLPKVFAKDTAASGFRI
jgi:hypothetical protein